jgi:hypothetical protein
MSYPAAGDIRHNGRIDVILGNTVWLNDGTGVQQDLIAEVVAWYIDYLNTISPTIDGRLTPQ